MPHECTLSDLSRQTHHAPRFLGEGADLGSSPAEGEAAPSLRCDERGCDGPAVVSYIGCGDGYGAVCMECFERHYSDMLPCELWDLETFRATDCGSCPLSGNGCSNKAWTAAPAMRPHLIRSALVLAELARGVA